MCGAGGVPPTGQTRLVRVLLAIPLAPLRTGRTETPLSLGQIPRTEVAETLIGRADGEREQEHLESVHPEMLQSV